MMFITNHNCVKSKYLKCPLRDVCYDMVDDDDECNARLEDYDKGRADAIEELFKALPDCDYVEIEHLVTLCEKVKEKEHQNFWKEKKSHGEDR